MRSDTRSRAMVRLVEPRLGARSIRVGATGLTVFVVMAVGAPVLAPFDPYAVVGPSLVAPSVTHPLGTNAVGQDVLSRLIWGARTSIPTAAGVSVLAITFAVVGGAVAGLVARAADMVAKRVTDMVLAVPRLPLLIVVGALAGSSRVVLMVALGLVLWAAPARVLHRQTAALRGSAYLNAARGFGARWPYLLGRHILPALAPVLMAEAVSLFGATLSLEAGLAFLGLTDPGAASWGLEIHRALAEPGAQLTSAWLWLVLPAGCAISAAVGSCILLGAGVESRFVRFEERSR